MTCTRKLCTIKGNRTSLRCLFICLISTILFILLTKDVHRRGHNRYDKQRNQYIAAVSADLNFSLSVKVSKDRQVLGDQMLDTEPKATLQESSCNIHAFLTHLKTTQSISFQTEPIFDVEKVRNSSGTLQKDFHKNRYDGHEIEKQSNKIERNSAVLTDKKVVIILAYYRSGSTLTGSLFQEYPGSFYVFEPLRAVVDHFEEARKRNQTHMTFRYADGSRSYKVSEEEIFSIAKDTINNWLTCKLDSLDQKSLSDPFHMTFTKLMKQYSICIKSKKNSKQGITQKGDETSLGRSNSTEICLANAISSCQKAPVVILKFVRLEMKAMESLLPLYPNMKIIHLVRDPRAVMNSEVNSPVIPPVCYESRIQSHCNDTWNNLKSSTSILHKYPDRLKIVYYEDIAENPEKTSKEMIEFTGLQFTEGMLRYIVNKTSSPKANDACRSCVDRKDSRKTANKWREELPFNYSRMTFRMCQQSNAVLGFLPFSANEMQRNLKIPSRKIVDLNKRLIDNELP